MKIDPFELERWLLNACEIDVGGGGVTKLQLKEVTTKIDYDQLMKYGVMTNGSQTLRRTIAEWFPGVEADNVLVTSATSEANLLCHLHLLRSGDEYVAESPYYKQTVALAKCLGCTVKEFLLDEERDWRVDLKQLNDVVTKRTKIIFFDNPNNPTGALLTEQEMRAICEIAEDAGAYVVCDNALRGSELDGKPALTPFGYCDKAVITGSISKLGATDPRIGWLIASKEFVNECWKFKDYTTLSHSSLGEYLATTLLREERRSRIIKRNLEYSRTNINALLKWIIDHDDTFNYVPPKAGFTAFPRCKTSLTSKRFCEEFLKQERVLISPGEFFGANKHFRINVGCTKEIMTEALKRLGAFVKRLR